MIYINYNFLTNIISVAIAAIFRVKYLDLRGTLGKFPQLKASYFIMSTKYYD